METVKTNGHDSGNGLVAVGHSVPRVDGPDKVSGIARYAADLNLPGLLHARPVLSIYSHAKIKSINAESSLKARGMVRVVTAKDLPIKPGKAESRRRYPLAKDEVMFYGHPIAIVLGTSEAAA